MSLVLIAAPDEEEIKYALLLCSMRTAVTKAATIRMVMKMTLFLLVPNLRNLGCREMESRFFTLSSISTDGRKERRVLNERFSGCSSLEGSL